MRRKTMLAISFLLAGGFEAPASAAGGTGGTPMHAVQPSPAQGTLPKTPETPNTGGVAPDNGTSASGSHDSAINNLLSAIADTRTTATALKAMRQVSSVHIVRVRDIAKGDDSGTIAGALKDSKQDTKTMQAAIGSSTALRTKLKAKKTNPSQVVAAKIEADGTVTVFID